ncbi:MAG: hypothetical protein ABI036_12870 [Fibrobacteria bacterium]
MRAKNWQAAGILVLSAMGMAGAHLVATGLKPAGGEAFSVGTPTKITWNVSVLHDGKMNIDFSKDDGATWTTVKAFTAAGTGVQEFNWTPDATTEKGKIRICQTAGQPACTNAQNTSNPGTSAPYILVTSSFKVATVDGIAQRSAPVENDFVAFNPDARSLDVSFQLAEAKDVSLQAFDAQGHLLATLLEGRQGAGSHTLSVFSNRLNSFSGALVFKLKVGDKVSAQSWNATR